MSAHPAAAELLIGIDTPDVESSTEEYAARFAGPVGDYLLSVQRAKLLELVRPWPGASVLDVGGGHAQTAVPLLEAGHPVTVLGSCAAALKRIRQLAPAAATAVGDLCDPPFDARTFDIAISFRIMSHLRDWRRLVAGLCRVARIAVIVDYPPTRSFNMLIPVLFGMKKRLEGNTRPFSAFRRGEVQEELAAEGFAQVTECPQFFWPMVLHRAMERPGVSSLMEHTAAAAGMTSLAGSPVIVRAVREG